MMESKLTRFSKITAGILLASVAACGESTGTVEAPEAPVEAVSAPEGKSWSGVVTKTDAGGYLMGNPDAPVKLIEYGSLTCSHCARFEMAGAEELVQQYVETGRVSWEYRNYIRDPIDMTAALIARCGTEEQYFPFQRALFQNQQQWAGPGYEYLQNNSNAGMEPNELFKTLAEVTGLKTFAAQRGIAPAKVDACLAEPGAADKLLAMNEVGNSDFGVEGTPTMVVNGQTQPTEASQWEGLGPVIATAVGE